jgi:glutamine amidotransferase
MTVAIVDYGMGNLGSVTRALEELGAASFLASSRSALLEGERIILPGVGSFAEAMGLLHSRDLVEGLRDAAAQGRPILGICLGMQLLASHGHEGRETPGIGLVPGAVVRLDPQPGERVPHIGWNEVHHANPGVPLLQAIPSGTDFYFVHSYHFQAEQADTVWATTHFAGGVVSVIGKDRVCGVQFHPEKSSRAGRQLLRNWLDS